MTGGGALVSISRRKTNPRGLEKTRGLFNNIQGKTSEAGKENAKPGTRWDPRNWSPPKGRKGVSRGVRLEMGEKREGLRREKKRQPMTNGVGRGEARGEKNTKFQKTTDKGVRAPSLVRG